MADLSYFHGVKVEESATAPVALRVTQQGATFVNGTAPDADPASFPINQPRLITSLSQAALLGSAGTLRVDVETILGEGGSYVIVNAVEHDDDPTKLEANLIGDPSARTGIYSALRVKALLGIQPRVIVTAGNTGAFIGGGLLSVVLSNQGDKLTTAPVVKANGGGTDPAKVLPEMLAVMGEGADLGKVVAITITKPGRNMSEPPQIIFTGGGEEADKVMPIATANIGEVANAYVSALATVCPKIRARAYISGP
ncbi:phage tail protein, partial [Ochrobactrum sp. MR28]|nr:phage tail protein [Ochrobactrum sp. MR28]MBX8819046.1 phage tail protein [Ochrobactrum sp. MR31]